MAGSIRFVGAPREVLNAVIAEQPLWRVFGERVAARARDLCPEDTGDERPPGPHLKETLTAKFIGGGDPRILIGTATQGQKLSWIVEGTDPHDIYPVNARALRFTVEGSVVFAQHVHHPGTRANNFVDRAAREIAREAGVAILGSAF